MTSPSGRVLERRKIKKRLHYDFHSFKEFSQDSDIDIFDCTDTITELIWHY
jgi:hypothetical protein